MGLFDKKFCDICGQKIGLLGNRKLDDGNLCKDCAAKLSPYLSDRRHTSVESIRAHLEYREANKAQVEAMNPTLILGSAPKVYIDEEKDAFMVTRSANWKSANPDVIPLSAVTACSVKEHEYKTEELTKDAEGKSVSYDPKRYTYAYDFDVELTIDSPWFSRIAFDLLEDRPDSRLSEEYRAAEDQAAQLIAVLTPGAPAYQRYQPTQEELAQAAAKGLREKVSEFAAEAKKKAAEEETPVISKISNVIGKKAEETPVEKTASALKNVLAGMLADGEWLCPGCGKKNGGNFCEECGARKPLSACPKCGWAPKEGSLPKFCPECGEKLS